MNDDAAREAAAQWLQLIDAGRYEEAASQGSQDVRGFDQWLNQFRTQRAAVGRANTRQLVRTTHTAIVAGVPDVRRYFVVRFNTAFEHPGSPSSGTASRTAMLEEITLSKIGCCWEIFSYRISDK